MLHTPNDELLEIVRELARPTTPEELRSRGVRHVRSIGVDDIALLIEKAVNRTLMRRTIGPLAEGELEALVDEARAELSAQIAELEALGDSHALIERQRARVRRDLAELRDAMAARDGDAQDDTTAQDAERSRDLRLQIQAVLLPLYDEGRRRPGVRRVAEQLMAVFEASSQSALEQRQLAADDEIELLRRRVAKLIASLETTEKALGELAKMKDVEHGIASIYRTVQGLAQSDLDREKKRDALERIFQSNLTLREMVTKG